LFCQAAFTRLEGKMKTNSDKIIIIIIRGGGGGSSSSNNA
jgi:hypothetical protein